MPEEPTQEAKPFRRKKKSAGDVQLLPQQWDFWNCEKPEALYSGAFGAGKTRVLCYVAAKLASHPAARVALIRKTLVSLKQTTLKTLLESDGDCPPVLPRGSYTYRKTPGEMEIKLNHGGVILPIGCDNHEALGSLNLSDACIDEATELSEDEYTMILGRCRIAYKKPDGTEHVPKKRLATNPGPPNHFLYHRFFESPPDTRCVFHGCTLDNTFLPQAYIDDMNSLTGMHRERYVLGKWVSATGAIYPMFDPRVHECRFLGPYDHYVAGIDVGFTHKSVIRVWGVYGGKNKQRHCVAEYYQSGSTIDELVEAAKSATLIYSPLTIVCDTSAALAIEALRRAGLYVKQAQRDWAYGVKLVEAALSSHLDGKPKMTFEKGLKGTEEYLSYRWKDNSAEERPIKVKDDAVDADRYATMEIDGAGWKELNIHVIGSSNVAYEEKRRLRPFSVDRTSDAIRVAMDRMWR